MAAFLPPEASIVNPIDMIASATPEGYSKALHAILADERVDMVMVINVGRCSLTPSTSCGRLVKR